MTRWSETNAIFAERDGIISLRYTRQNHRECAMSNAVNVLSKAASGLNVGYRLARHLGVSGSNAALVALDPTQTYRNNYAQSGTNPLKQTIGDAWKGSKQILNLEGGVVGRKSPVFADVAPRPPSSAIPPPPVFPDQAAAQDNARRNQRRRAVSGGVGSTILTGDYSATGQASTVLGA